MAVTVHVNGVPITVNNTDDRMEAQQTLQEAAFRDPEQWATMIRNAAKARQPQTGISDDDIEAIVGMSDPRRTMENRFQAAHEPETEGAVQEFLIGAGRNFTSKGRGAQQLVSQALDNFDPSGTLRQTMGVAEFDKLAEEEAEARRLYASLDAGAGWEDAGELLSESLMFLGGGSLSIGKRALLGTLQGAAAGASTGRTADESLASNTAWAAGLGGVANGFVGGVKGLVGLTKKAGAATGNLISMVAAASRGNGFLFGSGMARFFMTNQWAAQQMARGISRGGTRAMSAQQMQQAHLARLARDQASDIIAGLKPRYQAQAAKEAAKAAYDRSLTPAARKAARQTMQNQQTAREVTTQAQGAARQGFPVNREGVQQFMPSKFVQALSGISDSKLKKMGAFGHRMKDFRQFARAIEDMGELEPEQVLTALNNVADNPEARRLVSALSKAKTDDMKQAIFERIAAASIMGPARAVGQLPGAAVPASVEMTGRETGNSFFNPLAGE